MKAFAIRRRVADIGLVLAALISIAAASNPAAAHDWRHRHHSSTFFSLQFGGPGYYYAPPGYYYAPPPRYYYPPPAYYYYPPPPAYYVPGASFSLVIPLGRHH